MFATVALSPDRSSLGFPPVQASLLMIPPMIGHVGLVVLVPPVRIELYPTRMMVRKALFVIARCLPAGVPIMISAFLMTLSPTM